MKPIKFKEQNDTLITPVQMTYDDCGNLPVCKTGLDIVSCWKMSWRERIAAIIFGKVWICIRAGKTHPPIFLNCEKSFFVKEEK